MKKLKISLAALAFVIAAGAAVTPEVVKAFAPPPPPETSLYWFTPSGDYVGRHQVKSLEQTQSGCAGVNAVCENGYMANQLEDSSDPDQGLITSPSRTDFITKN